jgi:hypothetical protein
MNSELSTHEVLEKILGPLASQIRRGSCYVSEPDVGSSPKQVQLSGMDERDVCVRLDRPNDYHGICCTLVTSGDSDYHKLNDYIIFHHKDKRASDLAVVIMEIKTSSTKGAPSQLRGGVCLLEYLKALSKHYHQHALSVRKVSFAVIILERRPGVSNPRTAKGFANSGGSPDNPRRFSGRSTIRVSDLIGSKR